jgi:hypothetical protein
MTNNSLKQFMITISAGMSQLAQQGISDSSGHYNILKASAPQNYRVPSLLVRRIFNDVVLNVDASSPSEKVK